MAKAKKPPKNPCALYPGWSEAVFWQFIRSGLRSKSSRWPPKYECLADARRDSQSLNKRLKYEYQCNKCKGWFKQADVAVDHIVPVGTLKSYEDLPGFVERLYCSKEGYQVLCDGCHTIKTNEERKR